MLALTHFCELCITDALKDGKARLFFFDNDLACFLSLSLCLIVPFFLCTLIIKQKFRDRAMLTETPTFAKRRMPIQPQCLALGLTYPGLSSH